MEQLNTFVLAVLSLGLVSTAVVKNYHYEKFYAAQNKEKINPIQLVLKILGSSIVGMVWIVPFRITDASANTETQKHKDHFNKTSKYFRYFWIALVVYGSFCILIANR